MSKFRESFDFTVDNVDLKTRKTVSSGRFTFSLEKESFVYESADAANKLEWPLFYGIRAYGLTKDEDRLFKIEGGRKCPQGEGLYAFRRTDNDEQKGAATIFEMFDLISHKAREVIAETENSPEEMGEGKKERRTSAGSVNHWMSNTEQSGSSVEYTTVGFHHTRADEGRTVVLRSTNDEVRSS